MSNRHSRIWFMALLALAALQTGPVALADDAALCARVVAQVERVYSLDPLHECIDFYWHNGQHDQPPGSFNHMIRLGRRVIELDPQDEDTTTMVIWLLYSKYATWRKTPGQMPDGATKANEAIALARQSIRANPQSAMLPLEIGKIFDSMVQFYLRDQATLLYELYERANALAREDRMRIRARLNLGHAHRKYGRCEDAVKWYREVLLIDSANEVARRELSRLSCGT